MISVYVFGVIIAVLFIAGLVVAPWMEDEPADPDGVAGEASPEDRREAALDALQELEFEHETGKLSDDDYDRLRNRYARAAVRARDEAAPDEAARDEADRREPAEEEPGYCPECGTETGEDARYCGRCGARLPA